MPDLARLAVKGESEKIKFVHKLSNFMRHFHFLDFFGGVMKLLLKHIGAIGFKVKKR